MTPDTPEGFAPADVREQDARNFPHDEPCPRCGRRQWGLAGPGATVEDEMNPSDAEQETCGACGYRFQESDLVSMTETLIVPAGPPVSIAKVILHAAGLGWPGATAAVGDLPEEYGPVGDPTMSVVDLARDVVQWGTASDDLHDALAHWLEPSATYWLNANAAPGMVYGWRDLAFYLGDAEFWGPDGPDEY
jgi:hypothetical protein